MAYCSYRNMESDLMGSCFSIHGIDRLDLIGMVYTNCSSTKESSLGYSLSINSIFVHRNCISHCWAPTHQTFTFIARNLFSVGSSFSQTPDDFQGKFQVMNFWPTVESYISVQNISHCKLSGHCTQWLYISGKCLEEKVTVACCWLNSILEIASGHLELIRNNFIENKQNTDNRMFFTHDGSVSSAWVNESIFVSDNFTSAFKGDFMFSDCVFYDCLFAKGSFTGNAGERPESFNFTYLEDWECVTNPFKISLLFSLNRSRVLGELAIALVILAF